MNSQANMTVYVGSFPFRVRTYRALKPSLKPRLRLLQAANGRCLRLLGLGRTPVPQPVRLVVGSALE
jgi:hypothetical protein